VPTPEDLLDSLRAHLIAVGLGRDPDVAAAGKNPIWIQPKGGAVGPGDKAGVQADASLVVTLRYTGELTPPRYEHDRRRDTVDVWYRCTHAPLAMRLQALHRAELVGDIGRRNWSLNGMTIVESTEWAGLRPTTAAAPHSFIWTPLFEYWS
jgi:hypothetical protein